MLYVALPLLSVPVPKVVAPSLKVTVPVAADGVTVAVNVTDEPYVDGFADEDSTVEVFVFANAWPTKVKQMRMNALVRICSTMKPPMICYGKVDDSLEAPDPSYASHCPNRNRASYATGD